MYEGVSYEIGKQRAREQQAKGIDNPDGFRQILLNAVLMRDALREQAKDGNLEEALVKHLDGYLSCWD